MQPVAFARAHPRRLVLVLACLVAPGCAGWSNIPRPAPATLEARKVVQVWTGPTAVTLRQVVVGADSVSGVRTDRYPICDSCRVSIAQAEIDSFRIKPVDSANNFGAGMIIGLVSGAVFAWAVLLTALAGT
ncbi:MAG TPA: hypothetical protein VH438_09850 [Gemmatimonadales bacterium]